MPRLQAGVPTAQGCGLLHVSSMHRGAQYLCNIKHTHSTARWRLNLLVVLRFTFGPVPAVVSCR